MNIQPENVLQTVHWLHNVLNRPALPECPIQAATVGKDPKQPAYISGWKNGEPFVKSILWKTFQKKLPLAEMQKVWFRDPKTGVGTLAGWNGKHYLCWVDFDAKDFDSPEACDLAIKGWVEQYPEIKDAPCFSTPGGGYRFLVAFAREPENFGANNGFALTPDCTKRAGELLTTNGGHTLLPPTIGADGNSYKWEHWSEYPPVVDSPEAIGLHPLAGKTRSKIPTEQNGHLRAHNANQDSDREKALESLNHIDPNPLGWDEWRDVLLASHAAGVSESEARNWSERSSKHADQGFDAVWHHIKGATNGLTVGTLIMRAKEAGYQPAKQSIRKDQSKTPNKPKSKRGNPSELAGGDSESPDDEQSEESRDRPLVRLVAGQMPRILAEIERRLSHTDSPRDAIYAQGNHDGMYLSRVLKAPPDSRGSHLEISPDVDCLDLLNTDTLQCEFNERFSFERYDARIKEWKPVDCPRALASQFLAKGRWNKMQRLTGISHIPLLLKDGTVISQPGYHRSTGMLLQFHPEGFPDIPDRCTKSDAIAALKILNDWLREFPFQQPQHRSAALSAVLTAVCRRLLKQAPLHAISATKAGTGKGTLARGISILALNGHAGSIPFTGDSEEFRKKITSFLKSGQPIGMIDNVTGILGGDVLEMVLTEPFFKDRLLGGNQMPSFSTQVTLLANGNNLRFRPDMTRRTIQSVLDREAENPELHRFERNFEEFTMSNRGQLVMAALTVLKAYIDSGQPDKLQPRLGSFEGWSDLVRSSLVWLGESDPVETQRELAAQDDERQTLGALLQSWYDKYGSRSQTARDVCVGVTNSTSDLRDILLEVALDKSGSISPRRLSYYLRSHHRSVVNRMRFENSGSDRLGYAQWRVTVLSDPPETSSASSAQNPQSTQNQSFEPAEDRNSSSAPILSSHATTYDGMHSQLNMQRMQNLSSAPILSSHATTYDGMHSQLNMQRMQNLSSAPSSNGKSTVSAISAEDAEDRSSQSSQIVNLDPWNENISDPEFEGEF